MKKMTLVLFSLLLVLSLVGCGSNSAAGIGTQVKIGDYSVKVAEVGKDDNGNTTISIKGTGLGGNIVASNGTTFKVGSQLMVSEDNLKIIDLKVLCDAIVDNETVSPKYVKFDADGLTYILANDKQPSEVILKLQKDTSKTVRVRLT